MNHEGRGTSNEVRARDERGGEGFGRLWRWRIAIERERTGVGEAPLLVVTGWHRQRLESVPALLAEDGEPVLRSELGGLGGLQGDVEDAGGGGEGAHLNRRTLPSGVRSGV